MYLCCTLTVSFVSLCPFAISQSIAAAQNAAAAAQNAAGAPAGQGAAAAAQTNAAQAEILRRLQQSRLNPTLQSAAVYRSGYNRFTPY